METAGYVKYAARSLGRVAMGHCDYISHSFTGYHPLFVVCINILRVCVDNCLVLINI